jgi:DNA-binding PucR family transcriptional regulator
MPDVWPGRPSIRPVERDDPRIRALVASVASTVTRRLDAVAGNIQSVIEDAIPALQLDDSTTLLQASVGENVDVALRTLVDGTSPFATAAPAAAVEYARRLAQQDVPATLLIRAYRVGQARFLHDCIEELLRQTTADHLEVLATQHMVAIVSEYVDHVVEQVLTSYAESRDAWLRDRSAVLAMRIREVLRGERIDVSATERALDYRFDRCHQALVLWVDEPGDDAYVRIRRVVAAAGTALGPGATPLVVPSDECSAWAWLPTASSLSGEPDLELAAKGEPAVALAVGEPAPGIDGFRRSHRQATSARIVALAAGAHRAHMTAFVDVAPIAMLCADLESTRDWVHETLGDLAIDSTRNEGLRDTARVFLQTGGSYTATAERLFLHRNTAQYRVRRAEEVRGRPLRDGRLDVELALLACHWLKGAVLRPP